MRSENAVYSKKQSWQQEQGSCSGREEAVMTVGSQNQHGREEQHVGGNCWMELNVKGAIWIWGKIQKKHSKSGDGPSFILLCSEGCGWPLLSIPAPRQVKLWWMTFTLLILSTSFLHPGFHLHLRSWFHSFWRCRGQTTSVGFYKLLVIKNTSMALALCQALCRPFYVSLQSS